MNITENTNITGDNQEEPSRIDTIHRGVKSLRIEQQEERALERIKSRLENTLQRNTSAPSTSTDTNDIDLFVKWRNNNINSMTNICKMYTNLNLEGSDEIKNHIRILPKCMVHFTKKVCDCDSECVSNTFDGFKFNEACSLFDLDSVYTDDRYLDGCKNLEVRPKDGKMIRYVAGEKVEESKNSLNENIRGLCNDSSKFSETQCSAYELRDECLNKEICLSNALDQEFLESCNNTEQINNIQKILGSPVERNSNMRKIRSVPESSDFNYLFSINKDHDLVGNKTTNLTDYQNINNTELYNLIPLYVIGISMITTLACFNCQDKKMKIVCGLGGLLLILLGLILYCFPLGIFN